MGALSVSLSVLGLLWLGQKPSYVRLHFSLWSQKPGKRACHWIQREVTAVTHHWDK